MTTHVVSFRCELSGRIALPYVSSSHNLSLSFLMALHLKHCSSVKVVSIAALLAFGSCKYFEIARMFLSTIECDWLSIVTIGMHAQRTESDSHTSDR